MSATIGKYAKKMMAGVALCVLMTGSAFALDGEAFVERLKAGFKKNLIDVQHAGVNVDGANIIIDGVVIVLSEEMASNDDSFSIGTVTFNGVEEGSDGSFLIEEVVVNDIDRVFDDGKENVELMISGIGAKKMYLPPEGKNVSMLEQLPYENVSIKNFSLGVNGKTVLGFRDAITDYQKNNGVESRFSVAHFSLDATAVPNADASSIATLNKMGYSGVFEGSLDSKGLWNVESGEIILDKTAFTINDLGTFDFSLRIGGMTETWVQEITKLFERMQEGDSDDQATQLAILGLMQQLDVRSIGLRFDDASFTNKVLDLAAKEGGISRETVITTMVQQVKVMSGFMLQKPEFSTQLVSAAETFLNDPKSIEITATPSEPVSFAAISAAAMTEPQNLIDVLHIGVAANN